MAPGTYFVSISPLFFYPYGAEVGGGVWGAGVGSRGIKGGTWKFPKLGPTHRWLSVGGGDVLHMYITYVWMYVHFCDKKLDLDLHIDPHILTICGDFFFKMANPTAFSLMSPSKTIEICSQLKYLVETHSHSFRKNQFVMFK